MTLKGFHIVFVSAATLLTIFFGVWAYQQYMAEQGTVYLITTICSWMLSVGLVIYGILFYKKVKG